MLSFRAPPMEQGCSRECVRPVPSRYPGCSRLWRGFRAAPNLSLRWNLHLDTELDALKPFAEARTTLRDNAKWILSGTGALVILVVGGTTISRLGALEPGQWRFCLAVASGLLGLSLCAIPFYYAVKLLRPEIVSLRGMIDATAGSWKRAVDRAETQLGPQLDGGSVRAFVLEYYRLKRLADKSEDQDEVDKANDKLDGMEDDFALARQDCMTELVRIQFDELIGSIWKPGPVILLSLLVFAWAANPSTDPDKPLAKPLVREIQTDADASASLKATGLDSRCYTPLARVILLADEPGGRVGGLLVSPKPGVDCAPTRVVIVDERIRAGD